jgi:hypothetical protein
LERRLSAGSPVAVADIGGGYMSRAAGDILARYNHPRLSVHNIDLFAAQIESSDPRLHILRGDFRTLQLPRFDIIYSWQVLRSLPIQEARAAYLLLANLLMPSGEGFIDDPDNAWILFNYLDKMDRMKEELGLSDMSTPRAKHAGKKIWPYLHFVKGK